MLYRTTILFIILLFLTANNLSIYAGNPVKVVVIDAGHGGNDPGAIGISGVKEKDITLALALKVGALIEKNSNIKVIYTRKKDVAVELFRRAQMANSNQADYFISIHCNSVEKNNVVSGAETFVMGLSKTESNLAIAQKENSAILNEKDHDNNYEGFDPTSPEAFILFSVYQNEYLKKSVSLAAAVQAEFKNINRQDRGVKQAGFMVLWRSAMPSILIEAGFLSNKEEETYLASEKGQAELSIAIFNGFAKAAQLESLKMPDFSNLADTIPANIRTSPVLYTIQFLSSAKEYKKTDAELKSLPDIEIEKIGNIFKYTTGKCATHAEARDMLVKVKKMGFPDAFITTLKKEESNIPYKKTENKDTTTSLPNVTNIVSDAKDTNAVVYKIQLVASQKKLETTNAIFKNIQNVEIEKNDNMYRYYSGNCSTYEEAKILLDKAKQAGFADAFMVVYGKGGTRITIQEAREIENKNRK